MSTKRGALFVMTPENHERLEEYAREILEFIFSEIKTGGFKKGVLEISFDPERQL